VGGVPATFALFQERDAMNGMSRSVPSEDWLELCLCWARASRQLILYELCCMTPGSPLVTCQSDTIRIMREAYLNAFAFLTTSVWSAPVGAMMLCADKSQKDGWCGAVDVGWL
jgi:hypothetical protein